MNPYIENYIQQAAACFPILGKPERAYLAQVTRSVEDYFFLTGPESMDAVIQVFGLPQTVVKGYLSHTDLPHMVSRIRVRKFTRLCVAAALILCLLTALTTAVHFGWQMRALYHLTESNPPTFSTYDGMEP